MVKKEPITYTDEDSESNSSASSREATVFPAARKLLYKSSHSPTNTPYTHVCGEDETGEAIAHQLLDERSDPPTEATSAHQVLDKISHPPTHTSASDSLTANQVEMDVESMEEGDVILENNHLGDAQKERGHLLLAHFAAPSTGKKEALLQLCDSWSVHVQFHICPSGWIVFEFENEVESKMVLKGSPYFVMGRPVVMKPMPSCFEFHDQVLKYVAVWIQLPGLPLECWSAPALSKITSKVGTPLCTDMLTRTKGRVSFPRVLVEVDASKELVRSVQIKLPVGKTRVQSVVFEEEPEFCSICKVIGHACTTMKKNGVGGENHSKF
ncbi:hypothetical protein C2S51_001563 [Perilla frutescens var. frutescens]|nr:hypothetical protein C2S51_001563 [Perilla frutescens var. frutescens]